MYVGIEWVLKMSLKCYPHLPTRCVNWISLFSQDVAWHNVVDKEQALLITIEVPMDSYWHQSEYILLVLAGL